ncbi:hypothetical protein [Microvirga splendida]|uniref:Uncharacterized protein n=1 Tax=Microvirga splendida TaxID=2795727 RepID=A0ABS0Y500_9HYPH|nr:hypothetical protein [Microvirga splendida]MBJ6127389.1 hypothetical protein [Microvirga splendida]
MKTIREAKAGEALLRLVGHNKTYFGIVIAGNAIRAKIEGGNPDDVWRRLHDEAARTNPSYFGFSGAKARFLRMFPDGFSTPGYGPHERDYKLKAKSKLDATLPLEDALSASGHGESALAAFRATNLLSPFESTRMQEALRSRAADAFIQGAATFAIGEVERGLNAMEDALKPFDIAKWTAVTYLPFLWRPEAHMFLKPEVTKDFAQRVGHRFADLYAAPLNISIYRSLLDLVGETAESIADFGPRDNIDIQSFIWVVGKYTTDEVQTVE